MWTVHRNWLWSLTALFFISVCWAEPSLTQGANASDFDGVTSLPLRFCLLCLRVTECSAARRSYRPGGYISVDHRLPCPSFWWFSLLSLRLIQLPLLSLSLGLWSMFSPRCFWPWAFRLVIDTAGPLPATFAILFYLLSLFCLSIFVVHSSGFHGFNWAFHDLSGPSFLVVN